jgi:hypothetical protein
MNFQFKIGDCAQINHNQIHVRILDKTATPDIYDVEYLEGPTDGMRVCMPSSHLFPCDDPLFEK